jgi:acyl carrier protein
MIFEKVRAILAEQLDLDENTIEMDSAIVDDLGADSLDIVDLVMSLEDEFDAEIPDEAIENMKTVGDVVHFLEDQQG